MSEDNKRMHSGKQAHLNDTVETSRKKGKLSTKLIHSRRIYFYYTSQLAFRDLQKKSWVMLSYVLNTFL